MFFFFQKTIDSYLKKCENADDDDDDDDDDNDIDDSKMDIPRTKKLFKWVKTK